MRILLANKYFFLKGGAERAFFDMSDVLTAAGHDVVHFATRDPRNRPSSPRDCFVSNASYDRPPWSPHSVKSVARMFYSVEVRRAARALIRGAGPDLAILHNVYHQIGPSLLLELRAHSVPTVMVLHDYKVVCPAYTLSRDGVECRACAGRRFYHAAAYGCGGSRSRGAILAAESTWQWRVLDTYRAVDRFAAPSRFLADAARSMGFPFEIDLLRNAVELPGQVAADGEGQAVGFAGRLSPEKGLDVLMEAAARLPEVPFAIAGDGPMREDVAAQIRRGGLSNVALLGHLDRDALMREMARWRCAVVPSRAIENCPYAVLEPFSLGVPVIASEVGGMPELLLGRGVLVPPGEAGALVEAVRGLWGDPARCERLGRRGRAFALEECSRERYRARLEEIIEGVMAEARRG